MTNQLNLLGLQVEFNGLNQMVQTAMTAFDWDPKLADVYGDPKIHMIRLINLFF